MRPGKGCLQVCGAQGSFKSHAASFLTRRVTWYPISNLLNSQGRCSNRLQGYIAQSLNVVLGAVDGILARLLVMMQSYDSASWTCRPRLSSL